MTSAGYRVNPTRNYAAEKDRNNPNKLRPLLNQAL
jgi:hypothetical protein